MFQYMMHFRSPKPSLDLIFGSCWHLGLEATFKQIMAGSPLTPVDATEISKRAFDALWDVEAAPYFDEDLVYPKSPGRAHQMFFEYWERYLGAFQGVKIIGVELPFSIDLSMFGPDHPNYIGRLDLVSQEHPDFIEITDHKTAKSVNISTEAGFDNSLQTEGYLTAGHMYFDLIPRIKYSVALCQKTKIDFFQYVFTKKKAAIDRFLFDLKRHSDSILTDIAIYEMELAGVEMSKDYNPPCFMRNPGYACTTYFRPCAYFDICKMRNNPLLYATDPPKHLSINEWNPADRDKMIDDLLTTIKF